MSVLFNLQEAAKSNFCEKISHRIKIIVRKIRFQFPCVENSATFV